MHVESPVYLLPALRMLLFNGFIVSSSLPILDHCPLHHHRFHKSHHCWIDSSLNSNRYHLHRRGSDHHFVHHLLSLYSSYSSFLWGHFLVYISDGRCIYGLTQRYLTPSPHTWQSHKIMSLSSQTTTGLDQILGWFSGGTPVSWRSFCRALSVWKDMGKRKKASYAHWALPEKLTQMETGKV